MAKGRPKKRRHVTAHEKALAAIEAEGHRQCMLLYGAAGIALRRHWGKGAEEVRDLFEASYDVWRECAADAGRSMVRTCEEETGVEIQIGDGKSWRDIPYLNGAINDMRMSNAQWAYMRQRQAKWVAPQVMACLMVAMHREWGFGHRRCAEAYRRISEVQELYGNDAEAIRQECMRLLGIDPAVAGK